MNALKTTAIICCIAGSLLIGWAIGFYQVLDRETKIETQSRYLKCSFNDCRFPSGQDSDRETMRAYQIELNDLEVQLFDGHRLVGKYTTDTAHLNQLDSIIWKDNE